MNNTGRTPGLEKPDTIIRKLVRSKGVSFANQYYVHSVFLHWTQIVGDVISRQVQPQGIIGDKLYVYCYDAVWRNELRFMMPRLVQNINNYAGQSLIREIIFGKRWKRAGTDGIAEIMLASSQAKASEENLAKERQKITLSQAALKAIDQITDDVVDDDIKAKANEICRKDWQLKELRRKCKWHDCAQCGSLCPSEQKLCDACIVKEKERIAQAVRQVLRDIPWARLAEVRNYVPECSPKLLNIQRASMVQTLATEVDVNDKSSIKAKNLVMLYTCLPPQQLNEDVMTRVLYQLRFNLHRPDGYKAPKRYSVISLGRKGRRG